MRALIFSASSPSLRAVVPSSFPVPGNTKGENISLLFADHLYNVFILVPALLKSANFGTFIKSKTFLQQDNISTASNFKL